MKKRSGMMNKREAQEIYEKWLEGHSDINEERRLMCYLRQGGYLMSGNLPQAFLPTEELTLPKGFYERLNERTFGPQQVQELMKERQRRFSLWHGSVRRWILLVAACVVLLAGVFFVAPYYTPPSAPVLSLTPDSCGKALVDTQHPQKVQCPRMSAVEELRQKKRQMLAQRDKEIAPSPKSQTEPLAEKKTEKVFSTYEQQPFFPGNLNEYVRDNLHYPVEAMRQGIQGKVIVAFHIEEDGAVSNVRVLRSVHPLLDAEAVRLIQDMPRWIPGKHSGKPVRVLFTMPINFTLPAANLDTIVARNNLCVPLYQGCNWL